MEDLLVGRWSMVSGLVEHLLVGCWSIFDGRWIDGALVGGSVVGDL